MQKFICKLPKCFANWELRMANSNPDKTQEMCIRAINTCSFVFNSAPDQYETQEMCDKTVDNYSIALKFVLDKYKSKEMCDKIISKFPLC